MIREAGGKREEGAYKRNIASEGVVRNNEISSGSYCLYRQHNLKSDGGLTIPKANAPERILFSTIPPVD